MASVKSKNTKPEILLRKALFAQGYRYRLHNSNLPCKPDIILSKYKTVIFVHGCFWHQHDCKKGSIPKSNHEFWSKKLASNKKRDQECINVLQKLGWKVVVVWECEINNNLQDIITSKLNFKSTVTTS